MVVTRVGPMSVARIMGILSAIFGFVMGCALAIVAVSGVVPEGGMDGISPELLDVSAVFVMPLFYGFFGFFSAMIGAAVYNLLAKMIGGIEIDIREGSQG